MFCQECGAAKAILSSLAGHKSLEECHLTRFVNCVPEALDMLVYATPFAYNSEQYSIFSIADISHEKRRRALERIFFHDIINTAGGLQGLVSLLKMTAPQEMAPEMQLMEGGLVALMEEINAQKELASAETGELAVTYELIKTSDLLNRVVELYENHPAAAKRHIIIDPSMAFIEFRSDSTLLRRVMGNLVKNALEASKPGETITIGCQKAEKVVRFWVSNPG